MNAFLHTKLKQLLMITTLLGSSAWAYDPGLLATISSNAPNLPGRAIQDALEYLDANPTVFLNQNFMAIANFDQPSVEPRFYMIDLKTGDVKASLVSHGINSSDPSNRSMAKTFSNREGSYQTSLGFYSTFKPGELKINKVNGTSEPGVFLEKGHMRLRIHGLQATNSNAEMRDIIVHAAAIARVGNLLTPYVSQQYVQYHSYLGESEGCFAVSPSEVDHIVDTLEGASLIYAYSASNPEAIQMAAAQ